MIFGFHLIGHVKQVSAATVSLRCQGTQMGTNGQFSTHRKNPSLVMCKDLSNCQEQHSEGIFIVY